MTVPLLIDVDAALQAELEAIALNDELVRVRRALYLDLGVPFPGIHLRFNEGVGAGEYLIQLQEVPVARGLLRPGYLLVQENASQLELLGIPYEEGTPLLPGQPTLWVAKEHQERIEKMRLAAMTPIRW